MLNRRTCLLLVPVSAAILLGGVAGAITYHSILQPGGAAVDSGDAAIRANGPAESGTPTPAEPGPDSSAPQRAAEAEAAGLRLVRAEAAAFVPQTWEQLRELTSGPARVKILSQVRVETVGHTRHQASREEAEALNASRPADSVKPAVNEGDWIGSIGLIKTVYQAEVSWLDETRGTQTLDLQFPGGAAGDVFLIVDELPLPAVGAEYVMFIALGDGWATPEYVQFRLAGARLQPHMHNETGVGRELLGLTLAEAASRARGVPFR